jgi:hypothetical protein
MLQFENGMYVRIEQMTGERAPRPLPLQSGFRSDRLYRVLGVHSASETSECYLILANERDELWFISNRHVRIAGLKRACNELRLEGAAAAKRHSISTGSSAVA